MVRADYSARAELHIRSNAASRSLTQTHTQHTTRPTRKKKGRKTKLLSCSVYPTDPRACHVRAGGTSHGIGRLVCGVCRHAAHTTRAAPPSPHKLFFIRCTSPPPSSGYLTRGSTCMRPHNTQHIQLPHTFTHTYTPRSASTRLLIEIVVVVVAYTLLLRSAFA